jgi:16S rRNA (adenine(1408)-N(1))-methyltransferase
LAASLTIHFPWGSLLRGVLGHDDAVLRGVAELLAPGAAVTVLVSVLPRDDAPPVPPADDLGAAYGRHGLRLVEAREATPAEVAASQSSWAKRLRAGVERPVALLRAVSGSRALVEPGALAADAARGQQRGSPTLPG